MTQGSQLLLQETQRFVSQIFATRVRIAFVFHSIEHTREVVEASRLLAGHYKLQDDELLVLLLAAWFHDTGYSSGHARQHEVTSKQIATEFLKERQVDNAVIEKVGNCIMATQWPQKPQNLTEQILCDADLYHLGTNTFSEKNKLLRKEIMLLMDKKIGKREWREKNIQFLGQHQYFTDYARRHLQPVKEQHLRLLIEKHRAEEAESPETGRQEDPVPIPVETDTKIEKEKQTRTERSISTMFRIVSDNHVNLSQMADSKANIMISVNTIVMSIMVSVLLGKLQFYPEYIIPTIILLLVCLCAVIFAILATRPNVSHGTFTREDIENKKVNLLFFGNFYNMSLPDYDWAMKQMIADRDYLNSSMIKDIYFLGVVLARKYKYLRISYNIFMFGLIVAILAFAIAFFISEHAVPSAG